MTFDLEFDCDCDCLLCSLALALPKYSEHFIQAKLGDDMKHATCEYSEHPHDKTVHKQTNQILI